MKKIYVLVAVILITLALSGCTSNSKFQASYSHITDAHGNEVDIISYTGSQEELEPIIFSINRYGDGSITDYDSLEAMGKGSTVASSSPLSSLPLWAQSRMSTNLFERAEDERFRHHLVKEGVLSEDFALSEAYQGKAASIVFYIDKYLDVIKDSQTHENSHTFFYNVPEYRASALKVYSTLSEDQRSCLIAYLDKNNYALDVENLADEFVAHFVEESPFLSQCFIYSEDMNMDGEVSAEENYLWVTHHHRA